VHPDVIATSETNKDKVNRRFIETSNALRGAILMGGWWVVGSNYQEIDTTDFTTSITVDWMASLD
jgi:hypothetical protein